MHRSYRLERRPPLPAVAAQLVRAQIQLVGGRRRGHVLLEHPALARGERQRERLDDAAGEIVLEAEEVADRRLRGVGPEHRRAARVDELRRHPRSGARHAAACPAGPRRPRSRSRSAFRSVESPANLAAATLERTTSDCRPESALVIASARLNARKSVSGSARRIRNGSTIRRVSARAVAPLPPESPSASADAEVLRHRLRRLIAVLRLLGERPVHDAVERRHGGPSGQDRRLLVDDRVKELHRRRPGERRTAGQHLVQHRAGGEDVGPHVHLAALELFGRRVLRRAHHRARLREAAHGRLRTAPGPWSPGRSRAA